MQRYAMALKCFCGRQQKTANIGNWAMVQANVVEKGVETGVRPEPCLEGPRIFINEPWALRIDCRSKVCTLPQTMFIKATVTDPIVHRQGPDRNTHSLNTGASHSSVFFFRLLNVNIYNALKQY